MRLDLREPITDNKSSEILQKTDFSFTSVVDMYCIDQMKMSRTSQRTRDSIRLVAVETKCLFLAASLNRRPTQYLEDQSKADGA